MWASGENRNGFGVMRGAFAASVSSGRRGQPVRYAEPGAFIFTAKEVLLVLYAVVDLISRRRLDKKPLPRGFYALHARLISCVDASKYCASQSHSPSSEVEELIDTTDAASILHCSMSWVRNSRFREKIGGRNIGGRWLFPRQTVIDYAERKAGVH